MTDSGEKSNLRLGKDSFARRIGRNRFLLGIFGVTVVVYVATLVSVPAFATYSHFASLVNTAAVLGVAALGAGIVIIGGGIDLSAPNVISVAGVLASSTVAAGYSDYLAIIVALCCGLLIGLINGISVAVFGAPPLVVTLAVGGIVQGLLLVATRGTPQAAAPEVLKHIANDSLFFGFVGSTLIWALLALIAGFVLHQTRIGIALYAVGTNSRVAFLSGMRRKWTTIWSFVVAGTLSSVAGLLLLGYTGIAVSNIGDAYLLPAIAAVVIGGVSILGGRGTALMIVIGVFLLSSLESLLDVSKASQGVRQLAEGLIIIAVLALYSGRFFKSSKVRGAWQRLFSVRAASAQRVRR